jgi:hypothetical protein
VRIQWVDATASANASDGDIPQRVRRGRSLSSLETAFPAVCSVTVEAPDRTLDGQPHLVMAFTVVTDLVLELDLIADPERVRRVASAVLSGE